MRRARVTFDGAIHHGMNRGYNGLAIFKEGLDKQIFIDLLSKAQRMTRVGILAYCVMDNHYHLIVRNRNGRMAEFFKQLNGQYGSYYRKRYGGKGYVFQNRYKSSLIQDDAYISLCIAYVLNNPVKKRLCKEFSDYSWSSSGVYFSKETPLWLESGFVESLFGNFSNLSEFVRSHSRLEQLPLVRTEMGTVIGGIDFIPEILKRADRRSGRESMKRNRNSDFNFDPIEKVVQECERLYSFRIDDIDTTTYSGKRIRSRLLVHLKERAGLKYSEIAEMDLFSDMSVNSLGATYKRTKKKM